MGEFHQEHVTRCVTQGIGPLRHNLCPLAKPAVWNVLYAVPARKPPKITFEVPLLEVSGSVLDISTVTPCRLRFIDCRAFVDDQMLRIVEIVDLRREAFSTISYVWKGNASPSPDGKSAQAAGDAGLFAVKGAEDGDMISIDVVRCACIASLISGEDDESDKSQESHEEDEEGWEGEENEEAEKAEEAEEAEENENPPPPRYPNPPLRNPMAKLRKARYLCLDRLCIIQTSKQDKRWQIVHMFNLYRHCTQCLVLPGGIQRLVPLDEETSWVHRAWTLQEALAPVAAFVLFAWEWGAGELSNSAGDSGDKLQIIIPDCCAVTKLSALITACICGKLTFKLVAADQKPPPVQKKGKHRWIVPAKVLGAKTRNLFSLRAALSSTGESRERSIWQNVFGRTSSRPVDMIFSIMGLFGVMLDPSAFDVNDCKEATIALAQAILCKGGSASWIGIATRATPFAELSTFPEFPQTSVAGKAMLVKSSGEPIEAHSLVDGDEWFPIKYEPYSIKGGQRG
jgi:hypothetical protein